MEATQIWQAALDRIRSQIDMAKFNTWFSGTSALSLDNGILTVKVPSPFVQAYLEARYSELVSEAVGKAFASHTANLDWGSECFARDVTVRFCEGRYISPIKFTQLEIDSGCVFRRIDDIQKNTNITKILVEGVSGDLLQIRESQTDLRDRLIEHGEDLKAIKDKQDAHAELLGQLIGIGEKHTESTEIKGHLDRVETRWIASSISC